MSKNLEVIMDTKPSGGCGCNCGCGGSSVVEDMNSLVDDLKKYQFQQKLSVDVLDIDTISQSDLIAKINTLLNNTNAAFRVDQDNLDETLSNILPLIVLDGDILTAYGVPSLHDVVMEVNKNLNI